MISSEPTKSQRQERRQHTRTKVAVEAELNLEGGRTPLRVKTADLSLGGLYVEMMFTLEIGSKLKIVLWMAGAQVSTVRGDPLSPPKFRGDWELQQHDLESRKSPTRRKPSQGPPDPHVVAGGRKSIRHQPKRQKN